MPQPAQTNLKTIPASEPAPLRALIDAAVQDRTTPISRLLRLMAALEKLAPITAAEAVVIGDTPYDADAAQKAGLPTIGVLCGGFPEADLKGAGCIALYKDPEDLLDDYAASPLAR